MYHLHLETKLALKIASFHHQVTSHKLLFQILEFWVPSKVLHLVLAFLK